MQRVPQRHLVTNSQYNGIHRWLAKKYGPANRCTSKICDGMSNQFQWALKRGKPYEKNVRNFTQLCHPCHFRHDYGKREEKRKPSGHRLAEKHNIIIRKFARLWKCKEAAALRRIIETFSSSKK